MTQPRILIIAPDLPGISVDTEVEAITRTLPATVLGGTVTLERVERAIAGEEYDILHIATHASNEGVKLSDVTMSDQILTHIAKRIRARLVFLNACNTPRIGQYLINNDIPCAISYTIEVMDNVAWSLATSYYAQLIRDDLDYREAYEYIAPDDGSLIWFATEEEQGAHRHMSDGTTPQFEAWAREQIYTLRERVIILEREFAERQTVPFSVYVAGISFVIGAIAYWLIALAGGG